MNLDYCFVGKKGADQLKVLAARDGEGETAFAHAARNKCGRGGGFVRAVAEDLGLLE